jgi:hypothetical protein
MSNPSNPPNGLLGKAADFSDQLQKIITFCGTVVGGASFAIFWYFANLEYVTTAIPPPILYSVAGISGVLAIVCIAIASYYRKRWVWWILLLIWIAAVSFLVVSSSLWLYQPPPLVWNLVDVSALETEKTVDLLPAVLQDQLKGRKGLLPGGDSYQKLLQAKRTSDPAEIWRGFYTPLVYPNRMPSEIRLKSGGKLNATNASIGVVYFTWVEEQGKIRVSHPQLLGFTSLNTAVSLPAIAANERAAIIVYVFPFSQEASESLPDTFSEVLEIEQREFFTSSQGDQP